MSSREEATPALEGRRPGWLLRQARRLQQEARVLLLAARDPRVPWYARALTTFVVAHTLSPIDLIPDFIPVLGQLDDVVITPLGLWLALRMIPAEVMADARRRIVGGADA